MRFVFLTLSIFMLSAGARVDAVYVKLFKDLKYKGLIYEYKDDLASCHNVEDYAAGDIGSVKTDSCLLLYEQKSCRGASFKLSLDSPDIEDLRKPIVSFQPCSDDVGGSKLRVDMYDESGKLIGEYFDVCGCSDLPSQISTRLHALNNYGNCVTVYATDTCSQAGNYTEIPAGENGLTQYLPALGYYVRSISACGTRRSCVKLKSEFFKFKLISDRSRVLAQATTRNMELGTKTYFYNNGSATLTQEYEARKMVKESTTMKMSRTVSSMSSTKVDGGFDIEVEAEPDIEEIDKITMKLAGSLDMAFSNEQQPQTTDYSYTHEETNEFVVRQSFQVPPCVQYEVSSTLEMVEQYPVIYEAYARVTGTSNGKQLTAEEVYGQVDGMQFVEFLNEYTAVFKTTNELETNSGVEVVISGEGSDLPGCDKREIMKKSNLV